VISEWTFFPEINFLHVNFRSQNQRFLCLQNQSAAAVLSAEKFDFFDKENAIFLRTFAAILTRIEHIRKNLQTIFQEIFI